MKTSLGFLRQDSIDQIQAIVQIIKQVVQPEKIILFGSYAKGKWKNHHFVSEGIRFEYTSDIDFLVVTKDSADDQGEIEWELNKQTADFAIPVSIELHDIKHINKGLAFGQYFFTDIINEGILLYDTDIVHFVEPKELSPEEQRTVSQDYFDIWFPRAIGFWKLVNLNDSKIDRNLSAFLLHQVAESLYYASLLVFTGYKPKTHNLFKLRKRAKHISKDLFLLFPVETDQTEDKLFDLLKRGYIDARYKNNYTITDDQLSTLIGRVEKMKGIVEQICKEHIASIA